MKIKFMDKVDDKNYSLHFYPYEITGDENPPVIPTNGRIIIYETVYKLKDMGISCFLQGDSKEWLMIEFWTNDMDKIIKAVEYVEYIFGTKVQ
jgi:hypothetical protein